MQTAAVGGGLAHGTLLTCGIRVLSGTKLLFRNDFVDVSVYFMLLSDVFRIGSGVCRSYVFGTNTSPACLDASGAFCVTGITSGYRLLLDYSSVSPRLCTFREVCVFTC